MTKRTWTDVDLQFIENNVEIMTNEELAKHFKVTKLAVISTFRKCGVKRSKETLRKMRGGLILKQ